MPRLVLVRHGETEWSLSGRHTGRTDLPLTAKGEDEARLVPATLTSWEFAHVFSSPLLRARETARLAGFDPVFDDDLMEWDYGEVEGRRNDEITAEQPGWSKWDGLVPGGESVEDVGVRADRFIDRVSQLDGDVVAFAHGHLLSVTIARWLGLDASEGKRFPLATATVTVLGQKRSDRILETLNHSCGASLHEVESQD